MFSIFRSRVVLIATAAAAMLLGPSPAARADERAFTFVYETTTMPAGHVEYEQWVTWKKSKKSDSDFDRFDFRHELEFGVTDNFQVAIYFDWRYQDGASVRIDRAEFRDVAFEAIYSILDPVKDPIGLALYGEAAIGDKLGKLEGKLLLQKNIGPFIIAWNGILEAEWEGYDHSEDKAELGQTFGISYQLLPALSVGVEAIHEVEYSDWKEWEDHVVYVGPNVSFRQKAWWVTVTPAFQVTDIDSEPDFQTRMLIGFNF